MRCLAVCQDDLVIRMLDEILLPGFQIEFIVDSRVLARRLHDAGVIGFPFNMQKDSGFSRGGGYNALREYTQEKAVAVRLLER